MTDENVRLRARRISLLGDDPESERLAGLDTATVRAAEARRNARVTEQRIVFDHMLAGVNTEAEIAAKSLLPIGRVRDALAALQRQGIAHPTSKITIWSLNDQGTKDGD
jgi:hypothetical protein